MVEKQKEEKNNYMKDFNRKQNSVLNSHLERNGAKKNIQRFYDPSRNSNNMLGLSNCGSGQKIDIMKAPSMLLRQMAGS